MTESTDPSTGATPDGTGTDPRPRRSGRKLTIACVIFAALAVCFWLLIRYAGDRWWPATFLLYAPRWPWLLPLLILGPPSTRRRRLWILPLLTGLFILGPLMGFNIPLPRPAPPGPHWKTVRLLTCNIHRLELDVPALDAFIRKSDPDVIVLQDYSGWDDLPSLRQGWNTWRMGEILIASHFPISQATNLHLEDIPGSDDMDVPRRIGSAACFDVRTRAGMVHFIDLHLASPHTGLVSVATDPYDAAWRLTTNAIRRRKESALITRFVHGLRGPYVIAGDFNTLSDSPIYREFWARYPDAFPSTDWGYGYTHFSLVSELRLDHVLSGPGVSPARCEYGPDCGTPHRPMVVDLRVATPD